MRIARLEAQRIITCDSVRPVARSMNIQSSAITSLDDPLAPPAPSGETLHLPHCFVVPGLIDAHLHLLMGGLTLDRLDLSPARSRGEFEQLIATHNSRLPPHAWLEAFGWNEFNWGGMRPDLSWLAASGDRPAVAWRCDQHVALVNRAAMSHIDLTSEPPGGTIVRDSSGAPTGLLLEQAAWKLLPGAIPAPTLAAKRTACISACSHLNSLGVTTAGSMEYLNDIEAVLDNCRRENSLTVRLRATVLDRQRPLPFERTDAIPLDDFMGVIGFKSFADGTLGSSTAAMLEPYSDSTGSGSLLEHALDDTLEAWMSEVIAAGYSPSVHAIGDRALARVLHAATHTDPAYRVRFEHAQIAHPDSLPSFEGRIVSMQPYHKATDAPLARTRLGSHRSNRLFLFRDFLKAHAHLAFGSDWPIVTADPLEGMRAAITGLALDGNTYETRQNLTPSEALAAYTTGAAQCLGMSDQVGRLAPGRLADFVALDRDPFACDWMDEAPQVVMTVVGGVVQYDARARAISPATR